jgi:hypothetical protein
LWGARGNNLRAYYDGGGAEFTIGDELTPFTGGFDGYNKPIRNFRYTHLNDAGNPSIAGLFGRIENATVKHIKLKEARVELNYGSAGLLVAEAINSTIRDGSVDQDMNSAENGLFLNGDGIADPFEQITAGGNDGVAGGVVGYAEDSTITRFNVGVRLTTDGQGTGGTVGRAVNSTVQNTNFFGVIDGVAWYVGGNVGYLQHNPSISTNPAQLIDAQVYDVSRLIPSYPIVTTITGHRFVGGNVGYSRSAAINNFVLISSATSQATVIGDAEVGGLIGKGRLTAIENSTSTANVSGFSYYQPDDVDFGGGPITLPPVLGSVGLAIGTIDSNSTLLDVFYDDSFACDV